MNMTTICEQKIWISYLQIITFIHKVESILASEVECTSLLFNKSNYGTLDNPAFISIQLISLLCIASSDFIANSHTSAQ